MGPVAEDDGKPRAGGHGGAGVGLGELHFKDGLARRRGGPKVFAIPFEAVVAGVGAVYQVLCEVDDAGADAAITQYFYNVESYFYFLDQCAAAGIDKPIYAGVMPITNFSNLARFSRNCGAEIPRWICQRIEGFGDDQESIRKFGVEVVTQLCQTLLDSGAPGIHFYTMNQSAATLAIMNNLNLK